MRILDSIAAVAAHRRPTRQPMQGPPLQWMLHAYGSRMQIARALQQLAGLIQPAAIKQQKREFELAFGHLGMILAQQP